MNQLLKAFFLFTPLAYAWLWAYRNILRPAKKIRAEKRLIKKGYADMSNVKLHVDENMPPGMWYIGTNMASTKPLCPDPVVIPDMIIFDEYDSTEDDDNA